jgi:hypothetical protein
MKTSDSATSDDFTAWLRFHLTEATKECLVAINTMRSEWSAKGSLGSGRYPIYLFETVELGFRKGIDLALGECQRAKRISTIDPATLRRLTEEELKSFLTRMKEPLTNGSLTPDNKLTLASHLPKLDEHLAFALRQFDIGLLAPPEPDCHRRHSHWPGTHQGTRPFSCFRPLTAATRPLPLFRHEPCAPTR